MVFLRCYGVFHKFRDHVFTNKLVNEQKEPAFDW